MKQRLKKLATPILAGIALTPLCASAWTTQISCEGTPGTKVVENAANSLTSSFTKTSYSVEQVLNGSQSCKMGITQGSSGWPEWGGIYIFPSKLSTGSQLWIRLNLFVPNGFNYVASPMLKFMRVHTASAAVSNQGYLDMYIHQPTGTMWDTSLGKSTSTPFQFYYEGMPRPHTFGVRPTDNISFGKWESYEIYYALDSRSKDEGGKGQIRIWKNNQLLGDFTDQITLKDAQTYAESFYLFTYWNGGAPATQYLYVDDIVLTTETPAARDSKGNPFIGGAVNGKAPSSPTNIAVQ